MTIVGRKGEGSFNSALGHNFVDYVCSGEGDAAFVQLVGALRRSDGEVEVEIDGIIRRDAGETRVPERLVLPLWKLDELPYPDFTDFAPQLRACGFDENFVVPFETSRGCWWGAKNHCTFCGLNGSTMAYRSKDQRRALDELLTLGREHGRRVLVVDNIFDFDYLKDFFPLLAASGETFHLHIETKANLRKSQVRLLAQAGVMHMQPGIESLSTDVLRLMKKGVNQLQRARASTPPWLASCRC